MSERARASGKRYHEKEYGRATPLKLSRSKRVSPFLLVLGMSTERPRIASAPSFPGSCMFGCKYKCK